MILVIVDSRTWAEYPASEVRNLPFPARNTRLVRIIADDYGRRLLAETRAFAAQTSMALNGLSHAASEHLVMETQIAEWFTSRFQVQVLPIRPSRWWP